MKPMITQESLEALKAGDHKAYELIFKAYYKPILSFINRIISSKEDAKELTQEVFVKLWSKRELLDLDRSVNALLYTMARNEAYNFLKHMIVRTTYEVGHQHQEEIESFEGELWAAELKTLIETLLSKLPKRRGRIFYMSRFQELSNEEIAKSLNISKKTVENQLSLALKEVARFVYGS